MKNKRHDPLDRPLNEGGGFFMPFTEFEQYEKDHVENADDVGETSAECKLVTESTK